jgi:protein-L-isoaspartate(D-aspartate) O-methyltransferase
VNTPPVLRGWGAFILLVTCGFGFSAFGELSAKEGNFFTRMRQKMVETQIRARDIKNERVLRVMERVPRHEFVPSEAQILAYSDGPLPIGYGQTISQPYIVALMTELLKPEPLDKVLEIGTGSGYQAAVLAEIVKEVYTIEILEPLYLSAKDNLERLGYDNVHIRLGDGTKGWPEQAPFDKVIVTAAGLKIPDALIGQLKEGGLIVIPVGEQDGQVLMVGEKKAGELKTFESVPVRFVPLIDEKEGRVYGKEKEG